MSIFPQISTIEQQIEISLPQENILLHRGDDFLFDFKTGEFVIKDGQLAVVTNDAAVVFWIEKTLRTAKEKAEVYKNTGYGVETIELIGTALPQNILLPFTKDDIESMLYTHERISNIRNFTLNKNGDEVKISFEVELTDITDIESVGELESETETFTKLSSLADIEGFLGIKLLTNNSFLFKTNIGQQVYV